MAAGTLAHGLDVGVEIHRRRSVLERVAVGAAEGQVLQRALVRRPARRPAVLGRVDVGAHQVGDLEEARLAPQLAVRGLFKGGSLPEDPVLMENCIIYV